MRNLPASRMLSLSPLFKSGVDYAGPFSLKITHNKMGKAYLHFCIFRHEGSAFRDCIQSKYFGFSKRVKEIDVHR